MTRATAQEQKRTATGAPTNALDAMLDEYLELAQVKELLREHGAQPPRAYRVVPPLVRRTRARANPSRSRGRCWSATSGTCFTTARRTGSR